MPAQKTKPKSRVAKSGVNNLHKFKFRWWMALILVAVVAGLGVLILQFSYASGPPPANLVALYPNGCWIQNNSGKWQKENNATSCAKAYQRGRSVMKYTGDSSYPGGQSKSVVPVSNYPNGCWINGKLETSPASCQTAAKRNPGAVSPR